MTLILNGTDGLSDVDGSAATPAIRGTDANTGIFFPAADTIAFAEGGAEVMRIDSSGNLGVGTASLSYKLVIKQSSGDTQFAMQGAVKNWNFRNQADGTFGYYDDSAGAWRYMYDASNNHIWFNGSSTERMRIDSSGRVGIGTASPSQKLVVSNAGADNIVMCENSASSIQMFMQATGASSGTIGTLTNHFLGFLTNNTERARISTTGGFSVGTTSDPGAGAIYATGNITAYFSDDRLKTKLGNIQDALSKVKALSGFYYEANQTAQDLGYKPVREAGVSAQQVQAVMPEVVKPAPIDAQYLTVDYERLVPLLIEAIKELDAKIEGLVKA